MKLALAYKNFAANRNISHSGLGVAALNPSKSLRRAGIETEVWPIIDVADLRKRLASSPKTHVIVSALWIPSPDLQRLTLDFPEVRFAGVCHSNVGFLQADANGVRLFGEGMEIERGSCNFLMAGNRPQISQLVPATFVSPPPALTHAFFL